jgi:membrane AbrB-like protein
MTGIDSCNAHHGETAAALATGALGAAIFYWVGFPAPFLTGPAVLVALAILLGWNLSIPVSLRNVCFLTLGLSIGSSVTPDVLTTASTWLKSLIGLTMTLIASIIACSALLGRFFGFDRMSSLLSAAPGHLSYVLSLSLDRKADVPRVAVVQTMRVFFLTLLVPVLLTLWGIEGEPVMPIVASMSPTLMAMLYVLSAGMALLLMRLHLPAAWLLGGMLVSVVGHATGLSPGLLPTWLPLVAFVVMGTLIGTRFKGQSLADLRQNLFAGLCMTLLACAIAAAGALIVAEVLSMSPAVLLIAFAPGGVEVMSAMAVQIGLEPAFVAAHHVFRLLILTLLIPFFVAQALRRAKD